MFKSKNHTLNENNNLLQQTASNARYILQLPFHFISSSHINSPPQNFQNHFHLDIQLNSTELEQIWNMWQRNETSMQSKRQPVLFAFLSHLISIMKLSITESSLLSSVCTLFIDNLYQVPSVLKKKLLLQLHNEDLTLAMTP